MDRITVIIPAYNRENYLGAAIESVLAQTRPPDEIIVVDDGSTDRTAEIAGSFAQVRCLSQTNQGLSATRNAGIRAAQGELLAFLDSDDLWLPRKLEFQWEVLQAQPSVSLVFCHVQCFRSPELSENAIPRFDNEVRPGLSPSCLIARCEAFDRVGLFDTSLKGGEFIEWFGRAEEAGLRSHVLPELLTHRRVHLSNMVRDRGLMNHDYLQVLKKQLDRRRAAQNPS
jgi:glycosyltransferase involved in cell wall biosynthesis